MLDLITYLLKQIEEYGFSVDVFVERLRKVNKIERHIEAKGIERTEIMEIYDYPAARRSL